MHLFAILFRRADRADLYLGHELEIFRKEISMKNKLKVLRAERDWSQADLADKLNVSRQTVNAIEAEKYDPSLPLAFKIAELFGMKIEEIFTPDKGK